MSHTHVTTLTCWTCWNEAVSSQGTTPSARHHAEHATERKKQQHAAAASSGGSNQELLMGRGRQAAAKMLGEHAADADANVWCRTPSGPACGQRAVRAPNALTTRPLKAATVSAEGWPCDGRPSAGGRARAASERRGGAVVRRSCGQHPLRRAVRIAGDGIVPLRLASQWHG